METTTAVQQQPAYPHYGAGQRLILLVLELLAGVSAVGGGVGLIAGWIDLSDGHLKDTPFNSYVIPGLILAAVVGGTLLAAAYLVSTHGKLALQASLAAGFILIGWMSVQIILIGLFSWLQPLMGAAGAVIAIIAVAASRR